MGRGGREGRGGIIVASLLATLAVSGAGCGGSSGTASCTVSQDEGSLGLIKICIEAPASAFSQGCEPAGTTAADAGIAVSAVDGPCSRLDALGGCRIASGGVSETVWYYADGVDAGGGPMSSDIQMLCAEAHATFVAP
jgi:hypothetical protein